MSSRSSSLFITVAIALFAGACAPGAAPEGSTTTGVTDDDLTTTSTGDDLTTTSTGNDESSGSNGDGSGGIIDGSDIDWATVDLTTIDWANIDLRTIDYQAIEDNPTAANLTDEMRAIVGDRLNPGSATLTIGDMTWEFDNFLCAAGLESTQSDVYSFTTNTIGDMDETRVQMQATIRDDSGQGRLVGDELVHELQVDDITDFENPAVSWRMVGEQGVVLDGYEVSVEGLFDDQLTPDNDALPGTLVATCADQSRFR